MVCPGRWLGLPVNPRVCHCGIARCDLPWRVKARLLDYISVWSDNSLASQSVKNLHTMQRTWVWTMGQERPPEKGMLPTLVFWPWELHGQNSLRATVMGPKESETTKQLTPYTWSDAVVFKLCTTILEGSPQRWFRDMWLAWKVPSFFFFFCFFFKFTTIFVIHEINVA